MDTRARQTATVAAVLVSDATSFATLGLTPRQYRKALTDRGIPHAKVGRRTVARLEDVLVGLGLADGEKPASPPVDEATVIALAARGSQGGSASRPCKGR